MRNVLPENDDERGEILLATCLLDYFPNSLAAVARHSAKSNAKHNPGQSAHWARDKSTDHRNKIARHLIDAGGFDKDGNRHSVALAWRALALVEDELIAEGATPGRNAVGSPGNEELNIDWNACFPTRAQLDAKREAMATLTELANESQKLGLYDVKPDEARSDAYRDALTEITNSLRPPKWSPEWVAGNSTIISKEPYSPPNCDGHHPMQAEAIRDHDERLNGAEDRL